MSPEPSTCLSPKRQRISESSVDTAQLSTLPLLPCNLPPPYLDLDSEQSAAEDQNSSTSDEEWGGGAAAAKPRAGSKKSKAQGSKQGQSSHESTYKRRSSGGRTQIRGHNPRGNNPSFIGASRGRLQVPHAGNLPSQDPRSLVIPGRRGEGAEEVNNQATQKPTEDPEKLGHVTDFGGPGKKLPRFSPKVVPGPHGEKVYPRGIPTL